MLNDRTDEFYGARLVADARLHLGAIINGQYSEPFFVTMCKIMSNEVYLGYKTFGNKEVKLSGIKDFFFNSSYGLGVKRPDLNQFLANCTKAAVKDKSQSQYAFKFIKWLRDQDDIFNFPAEYFEYKRLRLTIFKKYAKNRNERWKQFHLAEGLYTHNPELLCQIGPGRKYKDVVECCDKEGIKESVKIIKLELYARPTVHQVHQIANRLHVRLDALHRKALIARLIELYRESEASDETSSD